MSTLDHKAAKLALRSRLLTLSICTTGSAALAATATGYTRTVGSFLDDGFAIGLEVAPTGFGSAPYGVITRVGAVSMDVTGTRVVEAEAPGRTLVAGLPEKRIWENVVGEPITGRPYIEEAYVPATTTLTSMPYVGGTVEETGLYVVRYYAPANTGSAAIDDPLTAILRLFPIGASLPVDSDTALRVRGDIGPARGGVRPDGPGWLVGVVTIPWRAYSINS